MSMIHPTAIIHDGAVIGTDCKIGPNCIVGPNVVLGDRVELISNVIIVFTTNNSYSIFLNKTKIFSTQNQKKNNILNNIFVVYTFIL